MGGEENFSVVEGKEGARIRQSEFMQGFDDGKKWLGEEEDFWIIKGAEKFLELGHRGENNKIFSVDKRLGFAQNEVDGVAS